MKARAAKLPWRIFVLGLLLAVLAGCATPQRSATPSAPGVQAWTGRLALTVEGSQRQSFSAGFELKGAAEGGELTLFNPLGGTAAVLAWTPGTARLRTGSDIREFASLDALVTEVTGAPIPVAALFDWMSGKATEVPGWQVDVSQVAQGRLRAQRTAPPPAADLRVAFER
jgi:outer membrane lipoprotein LolB